MTLSMQSDVSKIVEEFQVLYKLRSSMINQLQYRVCQKKVANINL